MADTECHYNYVQGVSSLRSLTPCMCVGVFEWYGLDDIIKVSFILVFMLIIYVRKGYEFNLDIMFVAKCMCWGKIGSVILVLF